MRTTLRAILFVSAMAWVAGAAATSYTTNTPTGSALLAVGASLYCNSSVCTTTQPGNMTGYATLTAWSTSTLTASTTTSPTDTGTWIQAQLAIYSGGIGISNEPQIATECFGCTPQHAIDNNGVDDILVVDFGSSGWDVNSFSLGYTCNASTNVCGTGVAVEAWVGGLNGVNSGNSINFTSAAFSANNSISAVPSVTGATFTRLALGNDPLVGTTGVVTDPATVTGRYLIITGALGPGTVSDLGTAVNGYSDAFKVNQIIASQGSGVQSVPTPGSLALMGLGLVALAFARRRLVRIA